MIYSGCAPRRTGGSDRSNFAGARSGAVICYDRPSPFLATLGRPKLKEISLMLDRKIGGVADTLRKA
jgi:hypothetical protein